tara:strand:- start:49 stop:1458 length:1410 start_codon:yes stop_codon:yes gene_type:complete
MGISEKKRILTLGDLILDIYYIGNSNRISPEAPVPIVDINSINKKIGGAGNVALNVAKLGGESVLLSTLGEDEISREIIDILNENLIENIIYKDKKTEGIKKIRVVSQNQQQIRLDFERRKYKNIEEILFSELETITERIDLIILSDYGKGTLNSCEKIIKHANSKKIKTLIDPKGNDFSKYKNAFLIKPNLLEFENIVGKCQNDFLLEEKGLGLISKLNIDYLIVTKGDKGVSIISKNEIQHMPSISRDVFDVTGAGDTFIATLGVFLANDYTVKEAVMKANIAAGIVISKIGTATVNMSEINAYDGQSNFSNNKIKEINELRSIFSNLRKKGKKIVMTNGCFDILHRGHIEYLAKAKELGDVLIIALNDDNSIKILKGEKRPINKIYDRLKIISSLNFVDYVCQFSEETPLNIYKDLSPDVLVKGGDYKIENIIGAKEILKKGGEVKVIPFLKGYSSSDIIDKIKNF